MEVYDCAHQLARELARSSEYNDLRLARAKLESNPANVDMLRDFRRRQLALEVAALNGKEPGEGEKRALEESYRIISLNPAITAYLEAEQRMARLLADIQKILIEALPEWEQDLKDEIDKE